MNAPTPLLKSHNLRDFDCGKEPLNTFLKSFALQNQAANSARTFVVVEQDQVVAYYSLAAGAVVHEESPLRLAKGLARHPIPIILMARFAVDRRYHGRGLGKAMLRDALLRSLAASKEIGARAFVVHAKDEEAKSFYERFGMEPFPGNPFHLFLLIKDIEASL